MRSNILGGRWTRDSSVPNTVWDEPSNLYGRYRTRVETFHLPALEWLLPPQSLGSMDIVNPVNWLATLLLCFYPIAQPKRFVWYLIPCSVASVYFQVWQVISWIPTR